MVLDRAADDLSRRCGAAIYQHNQRIVLAAVAMGSAVDLFGRVASVMRDDDLSLVQELVGYANAFAQQTTGVLTQIQHQALEFAFILEFLQSLRDFVLGSLGESVDVHVSDAGTDLKCQIYAVARNFVAHYGKLDRLVGAFTNDRNVDRGALLAFQQISDFAGGHVVSGLAINGGDYVTGANSSFVRGSADEGRDHDDFVVAWADRHPHSVVLAALIFAEQRVLLRIEEVRMRIKNAQHPGNSAVVNRLVGIHGLGVVLLYDVVNLGELLDVVADFAITGALDSRATLAEYGTHATAKKEN